MNLPPLLCLLTALMLAACSPQYDWREVRGSNEAFTALLPGKPSVFSKSINLNGTTVTMQMTAAEIEGTTFAIGSATMPNAAAAQAALADMKAALVKNINGTVVKEAVHAAAPGQAAVIEVEARGKPQADGQALLLLGRFYARERRIYQVIVLGKEKNLSRDAAENFFGGFKAE